MTARSLTFDGDNLLDSDDEDTPLAEIAKGNHGRGNCTVDENVDGDVEIGTSGTLSEEAHNNMEHEYEEGIESQARESRVDKSDDEDDDNRVVKPQKIKISARAIMDLVGTSGRDKI